MEVFEAIKSRRSIRSFTKRMVDEGVILEMLEAGLWAPSAGNVQDKEFVIVRDDEVKKKMANACFEQVWVAKAPVIVVIVSDVNKLRIKFQDRAEFYAVMSAGATIQNMMLFLAGKGLDGTYVGLFDEFAVKQLLNVPESKRVYGILVIGYPAEKPPVPVRAELKNIVSIEAYGSKWVKGVPRKTYI